MTPEKEKLDTFPTFLFIPIIMILLVTGLMLYGTYGEHKIYNETITVARTGLEDGTQHLSDSNNKWVSCDIIPWKDFLTLKKGTVMDVQISENVFGDKTIVNVWRRIG